MRRAIVRLELGVVAVVGVLVRLRASTQVTRLVRALHVVIDLALVVKVLAAKLAPRVAGEAAEGLVHLPGAAAHVSFELRLGVEELLRDEHLPALEAHPAVEQLVTLAKVRLELLQRVVLLDALGVAARGGHARRALETAEVLDLATRRVVVEEHVQLLVVPQLARADAVGEGGEARLADGLGVVPHSSRREHAWALLLADDAALVVHDEAKPRHALRARVAMAARAVRHELQRLGADHAALLHRSRLLARGAGARSCGRRREKVRVHVARSLPEDDIDDARRTSQAAKWSGAKSRKYRSDRFLESQTVDFTSTARRAIDPLIFGWRDSPARFAGARAASGALTTRARDFRTTVETRPDR